MPFMVIFRRSDGTSGYEQAEAIDEAAMFVERLRNNDGIEDDIRIYRMDEISFAFRPYYKVELGMPDKQAATSPPPEVAPAVHASDEPSGSSDPVTQEPPGVDDEHGADERRGLFGR